MNKIEFITDQQMIDKGFSKRKNYEKKRRGVSSLSWFIMGSPFFTIEKYDNEDFFRPTIRVGNFIRYFTSIDQVNCVVELFELRDKCI